MSASSSPTFKPRSRRPSARLSAVVDLPTPPLPEATAMTALTPGISACRDIGEPPGGCGGCRCAEAGLTPPPAGAAAGRRWRAARLALGGERDHRRGDAGNGAHRSFGLRAHVFPGARLMGIDIDREEDLAVIGRDRRQHTRFRQGGAARRPHLRKRIQDLLLRDAQDASPISGLILRPSWQDRERRVPSCRRWWQKAVLRATMPG